MAASSWLISPYTLGEDDIEVTKTWPAKGELGSFSDFYGSGAGGVAPVHRGGEEPLDVTFAVGELAPVCDAIQLEAVQRQSVSAFSDFYGSGTAAALRGGDAPALPYTVEPTPVAGGCSQHRAEAAAEQRASPPRSPSVQSSSSSSAAAPALALAPRGAGAEQALTLEDLEEALDLAADSADAQAPLHGGPSCGSVWDQVLALRPSLEAALQPELRPPASFGETVAVCLEALEHGEAGRVLYSKRVAELLRSSAVQDAQRHISWLEDHLRGRLHIAVARSRQMAAAPGGGDGGSEDGDGDGGGGSGDETEAEESAVDVGALRATLEAWTWCTASVRGAVAALLEILFSECPAHLAACEEWCSLVNRQLLAGGRRGPADACWCRASHELRRRCTELAGSDLVLTDGGLDECERQLLQRWQRRAPRPPHVAASAMPPAAPQLALLCRAAACQAVMERIERQVWGCCEAFRGAFRAFLTGAEHLVRWAAVARPTLRKLSVHRTALEALSQLTEEVCALLERQLSAADELDEAELQWRRHERHAGFLARWPRLAASSGIHAPAAAERTPSERQEQPSRLADRAATLSQQLRDAERRLRTAEDALPLRVDVLLEDYELGGTSRSISEIGLTSLPPLPLPMLQAERLARKLAELDDLHQAVAVELSSFEDDCRTSNACASSAAAEQGFRAHVETALSCPILHERMKEPVGCADGFTYERWAIERWLQKSNLSPMTGAPLAHRYLTRNFNLRHMLASLVNEEGVRDADDCFQVTMKAKR